MDDVVKSLQPNLIVVPDHPKERPAWLVRRSWGLPRSTARLLARPAGHLRRLEVARP
jgi:hypothetical protein